MKHYFITVPIIMILSLVFIDYVNTEQKALDLQQALQNYRTDEVGPTEYSIELLNTKGYVRVWSHSTETIEILHVSDLEEFFDKDNL